MLDADPENRQALNALDRLFTDHGRHQDLAEILRKQSEISDSESEILDFKFRLGQLYQEELQDIANAVECYREILATTPEHTSSMTALELLMEDGQFPGEIAAILEPIYRRDEAWGKLVRIMEVEFECLEDTFDKVQLIQRIAEVHEQRLSDQSAAFQVWGRALLGRPTSLN